MIAEQIKYNLFAGVAERQTRTVQVRVVAISWKFESSYPHQQNPVNFTGFFV